MQILVPFLKTLLAFCTVASAQSASDLTVRTTSGTFHGVSASNGIEKWLGLPFAQPPIGNLRFKAPVPITSASSAVKNATSFASVCAQPGSGSEDCLYLNVGYRRSHKSVALIDPRYFDLLELNRTQNSQSSFGFM